MAVTKKQYCTFEIQDLLFGVEVLKVQEVLLQPCMTPVPLAPDEVCGLMNLRGQIVPSLDLRRRLKLSERDDSVTMSVVLATDDGPVSLTVDQIGDVVELGDDAFEPTPSTVQEETREVVKGIYKLADRLLLLLNVEEAVKCEVEAMV